MAHARLASLRVERVARAGDPRLDGFRRLTDPALRRHELFVAESRGVVRRLLDGGRHRLVSLLTTTAALDELGDTLAAHAPGAEILLAEAALLREVAGFAFHRGCLALAERGPTPALDAVLASIVPGPALVVVVDDVADPDNVGALFRNAAAFGARALLLTARTTDPLYRKTIRVSMGESLRLPWARLDAWPETAARLAAHGFELVVLTPGGEDLERFAAAAPARLALVVGNEGTGVSPTARAAAVRAVGIRMSRDFDSLNVATATAVALYRLTRAGREPPR